MNKCALEQSLKISVLSIARTSKTTIPIIIFITFSWAFEHPVYRKQTKALVIRKQFANQAPLLRTLWLIFDKRKISVPEIMGNPIKLIDIISEVACTAWGKKIDQRNKSAIWNWPTVIWNFEVWLPVNDHLLRHWVKRKDNSINLWDDVSSVMCKCW